MFWLTRGQSMLPTFELPLPFRNLWTYVRLSKLAFPTSGAFQGWAALPVKHPISYGCIGLMKLQSPPAFSPSISKSHLVNTGCLLLMKMTIYSAGCREGGSATCRHVCRAFSYGKGNTQHLNLSFQFDFRLCQVQDRTTKRVTECYPCCFEMEI